MDSYHTKKIDFLYKKHISKQDELKNMLAGFDEEKKKSPEFILLSIVSEFPKASNLREFKDCYKRLRKSFKEQASALQNKECEPYILDLLVSLSYESFYGETRDLKGLINDLLITCIKEGVYANEVIIEKFV